jgi:hypothetical protein
MKKPLHIVDANKMAQTEQEPVDNDFFKSLAKKNQSPDQRPWVDEAAIRADEREACARVCETLELPDWPSKIRTPLAAAIRARGNT